MSRAAKTYSNPGKALLKMTARPGATAVAVSCRLCADKIEDIDHKEVRLLNEFISKQG
jgi:ribosomal protein S18